MDQRTNNRNALILMLMKVIAETYNLLILLMEKADEDNIPRRIGGSTFGRVVDLERNRHEAHARIVRKYFTGDSTRVQDKFRRRFRMRRSLFLRIVQEIQVHDSYFVQKRDAAGKLGISTIIKVTAALRQIAYSTPADALDETLDIGESTAMECLKRFCNNIIQMYEHVYLRRPNEEDIKNIQDVNEKRGFPGMLGSIDCMHWEWKNCPKGKQGQFTGRSKKPTIILEAVATYDLWIWHAFFGLPGSMNDINVLKSSNLFTELEAGDAPDSSFTLNENRYDVGYYLADGIYPRYAAFVKTLPNPTFDDEKVNLFYQCSYT